MKIIIMGCDQVGEQVSLFMDREGHSVTVIDADTRALIRRMWTENPLGGEDRIAGELAKLGQHLSPRTVAKYRPARLPRSRGQKWSTFIRNPIDQT